MYGIVSDLHLHNWSQFSTVDEHGVNSRLRIILNELKRAGSTVSNAGGSRLYCAGDSFHVRGNLSPSVLNPTLFAFDEINAEVRVIAGNHDLETRHATWNSNASSAFAQLGVTVVVEPTYFADDNVVMIPWQDSVKEVKSLLIEFGKKHPGSDVILHCGLNGVLAGIPDHGLDPSQIQHLGFKRVFTGHYHNHKSFFDKVYSVGATTHQTWGDVGSLAGFLIVRSDEVTHIPSEAPMFIDYDPSNEHLVKGNYVRTKLEVTSATDIDGIKEYLTGLGAAGVVVHPVHKPSQARVNSTVQAGASIDESMSDWIKVHRPSSPASLQALCEGILAEAS